MNVQSTKTNWQRLLSDLLLPVIVALIFIIVTFSFYPFREKLQFDTDEGLNLMRSMLVVKGYSLYSEISSDQPPLFNQILALVFRIAGFEVNHARVLVLIFSTLLVWSSAQFLQITSGKLATILFLPIIIIIPRYLELSVSVMIGVPSIALATVSLLFIALWHIRRKSMWLALSSFALVLSVLIKLFTGFLIPIFLVGITVSAYFDDTKNGFSWKMLRPALTWGVCFMVLGGLLGLALIGPQNAWSIIFPPLAAPTKVIFQNDNFTINTHLTASIPLLIFGIFGALTSIYRRNWLVLYPLAWSILAYTMLSFYSPVFYHHQLLVTVPMSIMAAMGAGDGIFFLINAGKQSAFHIGARTLLGAGSLIGLVLVCMYYVPKIDKELMDKPRISNLTLKATSGKLEVIDTMNKYAEQTNWIMTDMPMYAFRVQKPVPPNLATFSQKRLATGSLTEEDILQTMQQYQPEQVLMARFEIPALEDYLQENYTLVLSREFFRLFIRNDIKGNAQ
jgi:4-amino-4-deoxy-L-arabinose transferase-like glycosyltransferase